MVSVGCSLPRWPNESFYHLAAFPVMKSPYLWRRSHSRHHADTNVVGGDPEIDHPRPPDLHGMVFNILHLNTGAAEFLDLSWRSAGQSGPDEEESVPQSERPNSARVARVSAATLMAVALVSRALGSWLPRILSDRRPSMDRGSTA